MRTLSVVATAAGMLAGCASSSQPPSQPVSLATLPVAHASEYRATAYIEAAAKLQASGRDAAFHQFLTLCRSPLAKASKEVDCGGGPEAIRQWTNLLSKSDLLEEQAKIAVLCRMLFTRRPGANFERPGLGAPVFLGQLGGFSIANPGFATWPLEPIELVDGVPFCVVTGYDYHGWVDPSGAELYVRYCATNCDWSSIRFAAKSREQNEAALRKLLSSPKWERPLTEWERRYLAKQLE
jgi:hypothetical protein